MAENNRHLVATSATIIKTDNFSTRHDQVNASSYAEIPLINLDQSSTMKRQLLLFFLWWEPYGLRKVAKTAENKVKGVAFDL